VIYLDPMFPERSKQAAVKADLALLQDVLQEQQQDDATALLGWALQQDVARVVVKRPLRAPDLGGRAPSHTLRGKAVRFDVHVLRGLA
jgi:16S rRNA (guanine1516-N2)-methyltransferase